jgi:integrase
MQGQPNPHRTDLKRGKRERVAPGVFRRESDPDPTRFLIFWNIDGREQSKVFHGSLAQAKRERERLRVKTLEGEVVARTRKTVTEVAEEFFAAFDAKVARGERGPRTVESYRQQFQSHIEPALGGRPIQSVITAELTKFVAQLRSKRKAVNGKQTADLLSAWTLHNVSKVLRLILKFAYRNGYIATDPLGRIRDDLPVGRNKTSARVLEAEDVNRLIEATPERYRVLISLLAFTGVRISEALGLTWADVDLETGTVKISRQLSRAKRGQPATRIPLKTDAAKREIDLAPKMVQALRVHKFASHHKGDSDFVFTTFAGSPLYYRNASIRGLEKAAEAIGLNREGLPKLSFHDLRHTAITHLIRSGADVAQVQRFAGHSKPSITLDLYVGEFESRKVNDSGRRLAAIYGA